MKLQNSFLLAWGPQAHARKSRFKVSFDVLRVSGILKFQKKGISSQKLKFDPVYGKGLNSPQEEAYKHLFEGLLGYLGLEEA